MLKIVTDTASDMTYSEAKKLGVSLVSLSVTFDGLHYEQGQDLDFAVFYEFLEKSKELPKTSQPSPAQYLDIFLNAKEQKDDVLVIAISSGLSGTFNAALTAKTMSEYDSIVIVDSRQATISQRMLVDYAVRMRDMGKNLHEIAESLIAVRDRIVVCGLVNTLAYLRKGGRIPPALALIGTALQIKPVLILKDKKLEMLGKTKGFDRGKKFLHDEFEREELDSEWPVYFGYTKDMAAGETFMQDTVQKYRLQDSHLFSIGAVIGTHVGPGCIAIAFARKNTQFKM